MAGDLAELRNSLPAKLVDELMLVILGAEETDEEEEEEEVTPKSSSALEKDNELSFLFSWPKSLV